MPRIGWIYLGFVIAAYLVLWVGFLIKGLDDSAPEDK